MSPKIRKKDPCPCGSGKRYKDCCFKTKKYSRSTTSSQKIPAEITPRKKFPISRLQLNRYGQWIREDPDLREKFSKILEKLGTKKDFLESLSKEWDNKKLKKMSTKQIMDKLESMNVHFDEEHFKKQAQSYISAIQFAEDHYYTQNFNAEGFDEDFIWLAIIELWNRLLPYKGTVEMIDYAMQDGYAYIEHRDYANGLKEWGHAWNIVKEIVPQKITSIEEADNFLPVPLTQSLFNWCQDMEVELCNGGLKDKSWITKRITYTREFCQLFPDTSSLIIENMMRAEAESYALLKDTKRAEILFEALAKRFPHSKWVYIGWGDIYWHPRFGGDSYDRAEKIYRLGLSQCSSGKNHIRERLRKLEEERKPD